MEIVNAKNVISGTDATFTNFIQSRIELITSDVMSATDEDREKTLNVELELVQSMILNTLAPAFHAADETLVREALQDTVALTMSTIKQCVVSSLTMALINNDQSDHFLSNLRKEIKMNTNANPSAASTNDASEAAADTSFSLPAGDTVEQTEKAAFQFRGYVGIEAYMFVIELAFVVVVLASLLSLVVSGLALALVTILGFAVGGLAHFIIATLLMVAGMSAGFIFSGFEKFSAFIDLAVVTLHTQAKRAVGWVKSLFAKKSDDVAAEAVAA